MSEFMFAVSRKRLPRQQAKRLDEIVREEGGTALVEATLPGTGYQRWCTAPNLGWPFDDRLASRVRARCEEEGIDL